MSLKQKSPTWDETHYLGIGKYLLTHFKWDIKGAILHPPFTFILHDLPLFFFNTPEITPLGDRGEPILRGLADLERGNAILASREYNGEVLFFFSRLFMLPLALLLGIGIFLWAKELYSFRAGFFSLVLFCFSPSMIAHAQLITPDMSLTCFSCLSFYYYWKFSLFNSYKHLFLSALCFGCALSSKYTALLLFPIFLFLMIINGLIMWRKGSFGLKEFLRCLRVFGVLFGVGAFVLLIFYNFNLKPYYDGVVFQLEKSRWGHAAFLNGEISWEGWWYFLVYAFLIKTPIPLLCFMLMAVGKGHLREGVLHRKEHCLFLPVMCFFIFFSFNHRQCIGIRYILPVYPLIFVFTGRILSEQHGLKRFTIGLVLLLMLWYIGGTVRIYPHYLAFFNELVGGPAQGYKHLVDSNLDWGQDLKLLKKYMDAHGIKEIALDYFGSVRPSFYSIRCRPLDETTTSLPKGWCAVSATKLQGVYSLKGKSAYAWLKKEKPVAVIGYTIFVYYLT